MENSVVPAPAPAVTTTVPEAPVPEEPAQPPLPQANSTPVRGQSTKEKLLGIVDDIELIVKEFLESAILAQKSDKLTHSDQSLLIQLLMTKNNEFKSTLTLAQEQQEISQKMRDLSGEVSRHDADIQMLQKHLKEADTILSTALFQARQKLDQIEKAQLHQVSSEDLIRFAHRISSTNAVAAPNTWLPGDPRRPYPTDIEMRMGLLARLNEMPMNQVLDSLNPQQQQPQLPQLSTPQYSNTTQFNQQTQPWYTASVSSSDQFQPLSAATTPSSSSLFSSISDAVRSGSSSNNNNSNHDDVEVMSTDSSSSSSSDSQ